MSRGQPPSSTTATPVGLLQPALSETAKVLPFSNRSVDLLEKEGRELFAPASHKPYRARPFHVTQLQKSRRLVQYSWMRYIGYIRL